MATRARRSAGENLGLNPAMIHLLDVARLRKELEARGLDSKGNKVTLAERLEEAVRLGKSMDTPQPTLNLSSQALLASPQSLNKSAEKLPPQTPQRKSKRNSARMSIKDDAVESAEPTTPLSTRSRRSNGSIASRKRKAVNEEDTNADMTKATTPKVIKFVWATKTPIEAIEKIGTLSSAKTPALSGAQSSADSIASYVVERRNAVDDERTGGDVAAGGTTTNTPPIGGHEHDPPIGDEKEDEQQQQREEKEEPSTRSADAAAGGDERPNDAEPANDIAAAAAVGNAMSPAATEKIATLSSSVKTPVSSSAAESAAERTPTTTTTPALSPATRPITPKALKKTKTSLVGRAPTSAASSGTRRVAPPPPPQPAQASAGGRSGGGGIDLFDNIFSNQDRLLADKYKSEQEKALEKQLFELQKRQNAAAAAGGLGLGLAPPPTEKKAHRIADSSDAVSSPPLLPDKEANYDEFLPSVPRFSDRDPLNLRGMEPLRIDTAVAAAVVKADSSPVSWGERHTRQPSNAAGAMNDAPPPTSAARTAPVTMLHFNNDNNNSPFAEAAAGLREGRSLSFGSGSPVASSRPPPAMNALLHSPPAAFVPPPPPPPPRPRPSSAAGKEKERRTIGGAGDGVKSSTTTTTTDTSINPPHGVGIDTFALMQISDAVPFDDDALLLLPPPPPPARLPAIAPPPPPPPPPRDKPQPSQKPPNNLGGVSAVESKKSPADLAPNALLLDALMASPPPPPPPPPRPLSLSDAKANVSEAVVVGVDGAAGMRDASLSPILDALIMDSPPPPPPPPPRVTKVSSQPQQQQQPQESDSSGESASRNSPNESPMHRSDGLAPDGSSSPAAVSSASPPPSPSAAIETNSDGKLTPNASPSSVLDAPIMDSPPPPPPPRTQSSDSRGESAPADDSSPVDVPASQQPAIQTIDTGLSNLIKNPKAFLQLASDVLKGIDSKSTNSTAMDTSQACYDQLELDDSEYVMMEMEEKPLPDFHGEPVPDEEEDDDALFEIAAGLRPPKKKRDSTLVIEDEPLPDDEFVELDYYNADMNIKAAANNKWLIEPDNQDGFALMWGGVKSNYGILVSNAFASSWSSEMRDRNVVDDDAMDGGGGDAIGAPHGTSITPPIGGHEDDPLTIDEEGEQQQQLQVEEEELASAGSTAAGRGAGGPPPPDSAEPANGAAFAAVGGDDPVGGANNKEDDIYEPVDIYGNVPSADYPSFGEPMNERITTPRNVSSSNVVASGRFLPRRVAFQIKIVEFLSLKHVPFEELEPHDVRIGWSAASTSNMLGESNQSYMFCSNARKATLNCFTDYGDPFHINDVITTILDFEKREIRYYKNGDNLGVAFSNVNFAPGTVVFPHIATKNCKVLVNFGYDELPDTENPDDWNLPAEECGVDEDEDNVNHSTANEREEEYTGAIMIGLLQRRSGLFVPSRRPPPDKAHCTVIAMVGLPGAGKTTWVKQYLFDHPEEHWILFNTDTILNAMTVNGMSRRRIHKGRWDMVMGLTAKALNRSLQMACRRRHNYIIDQTNVSREARKKKLTQFADFQRKCVVILPTDEELERRLLRQARQEGHAGQIPVEAMLELKGSFSIPCTETEPIEDMLFVEPPISRLNDAIDQVSRYNEEGRPWIRKAHATQKPESVIVDCRNDNNPWVAGQQQQQQQQQQQRSTTTSRP